MASTCSFSAFLEEALRDRLVSGLHSKMSRTQRHLLAVRELTFTAARDRCIADELANKANKEHMGEPVSEAANKLQDVNQGNGRKNTGGRRSNSQRCEACGSKAHGQIQNCNLPSLSAKRPYSSSMQGPITRKFFSKKIQQFQGYECEQL